MTIPLTADTAARAHRLHLIETALSDLERVDPDTLDPEELTALQGRLEELRKRFSKLSYLLRYREVSKDGVSQYERR